MAWFRRGREALTEQRSPTAATQQVQYHTPGQPMLPEWDADAAIRNAYLADVVVARCTQIRAQTVASVPFRAGADPERPTDFNPRARLAQLLGPGVPGPAPKLSSQTLWEWTVAQRVVTGRYGWEVETTPGGNEITALWPLTSAWLRAIPSQGGSSWFSRFEYGRQEAPRRLREDQVVYGWDPNLSDFRQPYSVLQSARLEVSVAVMCARYNYGFLRNDARPAAVMVVESFENADEFRRFESQWSGKFGGVDNAGKMALLEANPDGAGVDKTVAIHQLGLSQKDSRLIEQHRASLEHIAIAMGVPWSKLDASGRTFDNAEAEDRTWWEERVLPDLRRYADEVNIQLAPRLGSDAGWFDLSKVRALRPVRRFVSLADAIPLLDHQTITPNELRQDLDLPPIEGGDEVYRRERDVQSVGAPSLLQVRIATLNEARLMVGLEPVPDGDRFLTDEELAALKGQAMSAEPGAPALSVAAAAPAPEVRIIAEPWTTTSTSGTIRIYPAGTPVRTVVETELSTPESRVSDLDAEQRRTVIWRQTNATVRTLERRWELAMRRLFGRQEKSVLGRLGGNRGRQWLARVQDAHGEQRATDVDDVFANQFWVDETVHTVEDLYEAVMSGSLLRMSNQFGVAFDLADPWAQEFIAARSNQLAGQVTTTTYEAIQEALAAGVAEGESIPDLVERVRHVFEVASDARATTIARTETISAYNGSAVTGAAQLGPDVVSAQEWLSAPGPRTRDEHAAADGQRVGIDEAFTVGGEELAYPGDPNGSPGNTVNCRCTVVFLTPEDVGRSAPKSERRSPQNVAAAVLDMVTVGRLDELAIRRALRQEAA